MCDLGETYAKKELERIAAVHKRGADFAARFRAEQDVQERQRLLLSFALKQDFVSDEPLNADKIPSFPQEGNQELFACCERLEYAGFILARQAPVAVSYEWYNLPREEWRLFILGITYKGQNELTRLERERREASWRHRLKEGLWTGFHSIFGSFVSNLVGRLFR